MMLDTALKKLSEAADMLESSLVSILGDVDESAIKKRDMLGVTAAQFVSYVCETFDISKSQAIAMAERIAERVGKRGAPLNHTPKPKKQFSEMTEEEQAEHLRSLFPGKQTQEQKVQSKSYFKSQLDRKSVEIQKAEPDLTEEQAFAKAYTDPANREIVRSMKNAPADEPIVTKSAAEIEADRSRIAKQRSDISSIQARAAELRKAGTHPDVAMSRASSEYLQRERA